MKVVEGNRKVGKSEECNRCHKERHYSVKRMDKGIGRSFVKDRICLTCGRTWNSNEGKN